MGLAIKDLIEPKEILIDSLQNKILVIDFSNTKQPNQIIVRVKVTPSSQTVQGGLERQ